MDVAKIMRGSLPHALVIVKAEPAAALHSDVTGSDRKRRGAIGDRAQETC
jgi:hypothetical protein